MFETGRERPYFNVPPQTAPDFFWFHPKSGLCPCRVLRRLRRERLHTWEVLDRIFLGIRFGCDREEAGDYRRAICYGIAFALVRSVSHLHHRHILQVGNFKGGVIFQQYVAMSK